MSDLWDDLNDGENQAGRNETTQFPPVNGQSDPYGQPQNGQYPGQSVGVGYPQQPGYQYQASQPAFQPGYQQQVNGNYGAYDPQFPVAGGPESMVSYGEGPEKRSSVLPLILGICILLIIVSVVVVLWFRGIIGGSYAESSDGQDGVSQSDDTSEMAWLSEEKKTSEASPPEEQNERPEYPDLPGGAIPGNAAAKQNKPAGNFNNVYYDESYTSEPFAIQVREAYARNYLKTKELNATIVAYSPVTRKDYTMQCRDNGQYVTCTGGVNAIVYIA